MTTNIYRYRHFEPDLTDKTLSIYYLYTIDEHENVLKKTNNR